MIQRRLDPLRKKIDGVFGVQRSSCEMNLITVIYITTFFVTLILWRIYVSYMSCEHNTTYGTMLFFILIGNALGCLWEYRIVYMRKWCSLSRYERSCVEFFRIIFLSIIPVLSLNQIIGSDICSRLLMGLTLTIPLMYGFNHLKGIYGRNLLYITLLRANFILNGIISFRTTFYGTCASALILTTWEAHQLRIARAIVITRVLALFFIYKTLIHVAVPKCSCKTINYALSDEQCEFFRTYYRHHINS